MKIITILGARPQFIKAGTVSRAISHRRESNVDIQEIIIHTGQHYDENMSDIFFDEMRIPKPDYFLGISSKKHGSMIGQMIIKIEEILIKENPDWVLLYGDTNSTLAGAIAASKLNLRIAHIEAGLRSFNINMPEEVNRILTDRVSSVLFCPTQIGINNLMNEGVNNWNNNSKVVLSGDVMLDGAIFYKRLAQKPIEIKIDNDFVLCTIHRAENTDDLSRLRSIFSALNEIGQSKQVIIPLHPRTKKILQKCNFDLANITFIQPVGYLNMIWLVNNCEIVMTDSGGLQKEAYFFSKPCLTLRDETEWYELIENGSNVLVGADYKKIINIYNNRNLIKNTMNNKNLYGDGNASSLIVKYLLDFN